MSFHETFWVVAGTAAPVIALAAVISLNDSARTQFTVDDAEIDAYVRAGLDKTDETYRRFGKRSRANAVLSVAQILNLCLQAGLLAVSLLSLALQRNLIPAWICIVAPTAGLLVLAYAGLKVVRWQEVTKRQQLILADLPNLPRRTDGTADAPSQPDS